MIVAYSIWVTSSEHVKTMNIEHKSGGLICKLQSYVQPMTFVFLFVRKKKKELKMTILFFSVFLSFFSFFSFHDCFLRYMVYNVSLTLFCINDLKVSQLSVIILQG